DETGGDEGIGSTAGAAVDDPLADPERTEGERIAGPGHGLNGRCRERVDPFLGIAEHCGQTSAGVEVEAAVRLLGNRGVLLADGGPQGREARARAGNPRVDHGVAPSACLVSALTIDG